MRRGGLAAAAVLLTALVASLLLLADPTGSVGALVPGAPTDIQVTSAVFDACQADGLTPDVGDLQLTLTDPDGGPPAGIQVAAVPAGSVAPGSPIPQTGAIPSYVYMSTPTIKLWVAGTSPSGTRFLTDPANLPDVVIQADGFDPEVVTLPTPTCDVTQNPSALAGLATPTSPTVSAPTCDPTSGNLTFDLNLSIATPDITALTATTSMNELDEGVYILNGSGALIRATASLARFIPDPLTPTVPPAVLSPSLAVTVPMGWIPQTDGLLTGFSTLVVDPSGQVVTSPLTDSNGGTLICLPTPTPAPTTSAPSSATSSSDPASPSDTSSPSPSDTSSSSAPTSTADPSVPAGPPTDTSVASPTFSAPSDTASNPGSLSSSPTAPDTSARPSDSVTTSDGAIPTSSDITSTPERPSSSITPTLDVTAASSGARFEPSLADAASSSVRPLQLLAWHRDTAIVVGIDAVAIFALVGATVWSARRR